MPLPTDPKERKNVPIARGLLDYFPDACCAVAELSRIGNDQHNPGKFLHWDRSKSGDESDALIRHFIERGTTDSDGVLHSVKVSWRALALLQKELEAKGHVLKFGKRTVLSIADKQNGRLRWNVQCDCGAIFTCLTQDLKRNKETGCKNCVHKGPRLTRRKRPYEWRYNAALNRARHPMLMSYEEFIKFTLITECHYCGESINWGPPFGQKRPSGLNLDRKDNNIPYSVDNVVVACRRCNYAKNNFFSYIEWKELGNIIKTWRQT